MALEFEFVILLTFRSPLLWMSNFKSWLGVGAFFSALCLCMHPVANRATGHAQDNLGSYLTE
jgi:hypothetical protein